MVESDRNASAAGDGNRYLRYDFSLQAAPPRRRGFLSVLCEDFRARCAWYGWPAGSAAAIARSLVTDGSLATILYRAMRWCDEHGLSPAAMVLGKLLTFFCGAVIGRRAQFGPGLVLLHPIAVVINTRVVGGRNCIIESCVTIGAEKEASPVLGNRVFLGSGAKVIGGRRIGSDVRIGANAVVVDDIPAGATAVGVPARVVRVRPAEEAQP